MNSFIGQVVRLLRRVTGLTPRQLTLPYAWIPYHLYQDGSAWRPLSVTLELTYLCNLRCQMCCARRGRPRDPAAARGGTPNCASPTGRSGGKSRPRSTSTSSGKSAGPACAR